MNLPILSLPEVLFQRTQEAKLSDKVKRLSGERPATRTVECSEDGRISDAITEEMMEHRLELAWSLVGTIPMLVSIHPLANSVN